jgi:HD-GYP domain-containing protein (c-di-GMP phosphodiesterase class II)
MPPSTSTHGMKPEALRQQGAELAGRAPELLKTSLKLLPEGLRRGIGRNDGDETWKTVPKDRKDGKGELIQSMMSDRHLMLALIYNKILTLAKGMGWSPEAQAAAADLIYPVVDVAERTCFTYYGHGYRTMQYGKLILDFAHVEDPERAGHLLGFLLHDVGKAAVPGKILRKDGFPTDSQYKRIKRHPQDGRTVLLAAEAALVKAGLIAGGELEASAAVIFGHHEKFDGSGYPLGMRGPAIPLSARRAGFCDSWETMTSVRIYRPVPLTYGDAKEDVERHGNEQFNGHIVQDFLAIAENATADAEIRRIMRCACGK